MGESNSNFDCTIVIPVYFNEGCLFPTWQALQRDVFAPRNDLRFEVIFVDDGSGDGSLRELLKIREESPDNVRVIKLTRNFGQVSAMIAGYRHARGNCVVSVSADGQDPAGLILQMLDAYRNENYEVVVCTREGRDESYFRVVTSRIFYSLMRKLSLKNMPAGGFDYFLLGRRALGSFLRNLDSHPFLQGQVLWLGYKTKFISYTRRKRTAGKSRWTLGKKLTYLLDGVLSYSFLPIRFMSLSGIVFATLGFVYAGVVFFNRFLFDNPVKGWAPLMIVVLVMGGFQLTMLGLIGEYLWRTLAQGRNREAYIIDEIFE